MTRPDPVTRPDPIVEHDETDSLYKKCQRHSCSAINCLSSGINILAGGSSVTLISERKGTDPPLEARALHTLRLISRGSRPLASLACVRLTGWPVISTVGSIVGWTVKPMFTQFDCQSNSSTNCPINSWTDCSSSCQIYTQTV